MPYECWKRQVSSLLARVEATRSTRMQKEKELLYHFIQEKSFILRS